MQNIAALMAKSDNFDLRKFGSDLYLATELDFEKVISNKHSSVFKGPLLSEHGVALSYIKQNFDDENGSASVRISEVECGQNYRLLTLKPDNKLTLLLSTANGPATEICFKYNKKPNGSQSLSITSVKEVLRELCADAD